MTNTDEGFSSNAADVSLDGKAFHRGRGTQIAGLVLVVAAMVAGAVYLLLPGDDAAYSAVGKKINGLDERNFDAFMGCAVGNRNLQKIGSNLDLQNQIFAASVAGKRYGAHLREDCMPKLDAMSAELEGLLPPEPLQAQVGELRAAVDALRGAWSAYVAHLENLDGGFDADAAKKPVEEAVAAWRDYKVALSAINGTLREKLEG